MTFIRTTHIKRFQNCFVNLKNKTQNVDKKNILKLFFLNLAQQLITIYNKQYTRRRKNITIVIVYYINSVSYD